MVKKRLSDLLQEEAEKFTPPQGEPVIEVTAEQVSEENASALEELTTESPTQIPEPTTTKRTVPTKADLETTIKELQESLEQANQKQASLQQQVVDSQADVAEQKALAERLIKELDEAKQAAVHLAAANSLLIEEINALKAETEIYKQQKEIPKQELEIQQHEKEAYNPLSYRKSHRSSIKLATKQPEEETDNSSQMWLLD
ncbi:MAG: hypothetical protein HEQ35_13840 [Gloeotrichia echinulata IR180]|jgi:chromosome segregation ATPase